MRRQQVVGFSTFMFFLGCAATLFISSGAANAQSDVVFMLGDDFGTQSYLHRFDAGTQTYATNTGAGSAFRGVAMLGDEVLVGDYIGDAIQRFALDGTYAGQFVSLVDAAFVETDAADNVYVTTLNSFAGRLNSSGMFTQSFAVTAPRGIDADAAGNVYIMENGSPDRLFKFAPNGAFLNSVPLTGISGVDLAIDEVGQRLFLADEFGATGIKIFDISGAMPSLIGSIATPADANIVGVHYAAESGNVLGADFGLVGSNGPRGLEYSPSGVLLETYVPIGREVALDITTYAAVPEPASAALLLMAAAGFVVVGWRGR